MLAAPICHDPRLLAGRWKSRFSDQKCFGLWDQISDDGGFESFFVSYRWSHVPTSFSIAAEIPPKSEQPKWLVGISCWEMLDYSYFNSLDTTSFHFPA